MTEQRGGALLRTGSSPGRATFLELFFDLVFVFALTRVSQRLINGLDGSPGAVAGEVAKTLLLFLVLWQVWTITTWVTSRYEPERVVIQTVVVGTMFGSLVLGVTLPRALEERALPFALAYVVVMVGRPLVIAAALRGHPRRLVPLRLAAWAGISTPLWIAGALMPGPRLALWVVALAVDRLGTLLGWPLPGIGASRIREWLVAGEHLAERYQQIFLIALGESILVIGMTYSGKEFSVDAAAAFAISFVITALLWRIYFYRAGHLLAEALRMAGTPGRLAESAVQTHLFMVLGVLSAAVGYELVIAHPYDTARPNWLVFVVGGPALFLAARSRFEYEIFGRVSRPRLAGLLVLMLILPALAAVPAMFALGAVALVLALVALADARRAWHRPPEPSASPIGREMLGEAGPEA
ncbi:MULTISPECIES: low temperature requirement protein A [unclassified Micromonospora]|uniref:low temperature requirement protein A n=1 Tax=unclassified Micromonospora TaxID=2617518 RepID=UPI001C2139D7|nr:MULTISPECIES: low temperature requirement protein A [unclassified Micromonospora]MBU8859589.1 low temperature requirement protein A [Micromonospora sp. WMMB482]MDM4779105.1 low temperature requirement protein A [Micromonospora sp. b486]